MIPGIFKHPTEKLLIINKITQKLPLEVVDIIKKHLYYVKNSLPFLKIISKRKKELNLIKQAWSRNNPGSPQFTIENLNIRLGTNCNKCGEYHKMYMDIQSTSPWVNHRHAVSLDESKLCNCDLSSLDDFEYFNQPDSFGYDDGDCMCGGCAVCEMKETEFWENQQNEYEAEFGEEDNDQFSSDSEEEDIEILVDEETGRRYSHNLKTRLTKWLDVDSDDDLWEQADYDYWFGET